MPFMYKTLNKLELKGNYININYINIEGNYVNIGLGHSNPRIKLKNFCTHKYNTMFRLITHIKETRLIKNSHKEYLPAKIFLNC